MRSFLLGLGLIFALSGCIVVHDDPHDDCWEGETACHDSEHVEECFDGRWVIVEHCEDLCGGFCDYDGYDEAVCFCP